MAEQTITLPVTGMTCADCAANIERGFKRLHSLLFRIPKFCPAKEIGG